MHGAAHARKRAALVGCDHACRLALALGEAGQTLQRKPDALAPGDLRWADQGGMGLSQTVH